MYVLLLFNFFFSYMYFFFSMGGEGVRIKREGGKEEKGGGELKEEKGGGELKEEEKQEKG